MSESLNGEMEWKRYYVAKVQLSLSVLKENMLTVDDFFQHIYHFSVEENREFVSCFEDNTFQKFTELYQKCICLVESVDLDLLFVESNFCDAEILMLCGFRSTPGSLTIFPPLEERLLEQFTLPWHGEEGLSVGARALSKHVHRSLGGWYGMESRKFTGNFAAKNECALHVVKEILRNAVWRNIHGLPHDVVVYEVRVREGYGCRWLLNQEFRGFLEPMMEDGHERGWIH
jgi:hypothetical protein